MTAELHDRIRQYAEALDAVAAPLEDLVPASVETGATSDVRLPTVEISVPAPWQPRRRQGWIYALAGAGAVLLLALPLLLWGDRLVDDVATTSPPPDATLRSPLPDATLVSPPPDQYAAIDLLPRSRVNGQAWPASSTIRMSKDGGSSWVELGRVRDDGRFDLPVPFEMDPGDVVSVEVGGVITDSVIPAMAVVELDEEADRVVGTTDLPVEATCCIAVFMFTDPGDSQAEDFPMTIFEDGTWVAELAGLFDVTNFTRLDVVYGDPNGLWVTWSHDVLIGG